MQSHHHQSQEAATAHWVLRAPMCWLDLLSQNLVTTVGIFLLSWCFHVYVSVSSARTSMRRSEQLAAGAGERLPNMCALLLPTSRHADVADTLINPTVPTYAIFNCVRSWYSYEDWRILSVRPSRSGVLSRRMKIQSCGFQYQVGNHSSFWKTVITSPSLS